MLPEVKSGTGNSSSQKSIAKSLTKYSRLIGLLLLAFLLLKIDLRATLATLLSVNVWPMVVAIVANVPQLGLKALRWRFLLSLQGVSYRPLRAAEPVFSTARIKHSCVSIGCSDVRTTKYAIFTMSGT